MIGVLLVFLSIGGVGGYMVAEMVGCGIVGQILCSSFGVLVVGSILLGD